MMEINLFLMLLKKEPGVLSQINLLKKIITKLLKKQLYFFLNHFAKLKRKKLLRQLLQ